MRYVTGETLTPVKPVWLDVRNHPAPTRSSTFPAAASASTFSRTATFTMPESGRLVSGGGHLHGGVRRRAAQLHLWDGAVRVASDLGRPEAETAAARAGADEDVFVPDDCGDPGREG